MTVLGIDASDREPVKGWESLEPKPISKLEAAYEAAKDEAEDAWRWFYFIADNWGYVKLKFGEGSSQELIERNHLYEQKKIAEDADKKKEIAYEQMNCPHVHVSQYGDITICDDCGAKF